MKTQILTLALAVAVGGCGSIPTPEYVSSEKSPALSPYTLRHLIDHIDCEFERLPRQQLIDLAAYDYVAVVTLNLKVEDNGGLSPSLAFIPSAEYTFGINGDFNVARTHVFTTEYTRRIASLAANRRKDCPRRDNLSGDLGIAGMVSGGLDAIDFRQLNDVKHGDDGPVDNYPLPPTFGGTVEFAISSSLDIGPNWSLKNFKGPSESKGILNGGRVETDNLVLALSPNNTHRDPAVDAAANALAVAEHARDLLLTSRSQFTTLSPEAKTKSDQEVAAAESDIAEKEKALAASPSAPAQLDGAQNAKNFTVNAILQNLTGKVQ
jgi:hypothetical protein